MIGIVSCPMKSGLWNRITIVTVLFLCSCPHHAGHLVPDADQGLQAEVGQPSPGGVITPSAEPANPLVDPEEGIRTYLIGLLEGKGLEPDRARMLIEDPRLVFDPGFILKNLRTAPPRAAPATPGIMEYDPVYVARGRSFIEANRELFSAIEERYGTSPEIITAILIVETRLGTYPMRYRAMRVFSNMALAQDPVFIASLQEHYKSLSHLLEDEEVLNVATAKARWASGELFELILLAEELGLDPHEIKGSVSGALGPGQFIPSTFRKYGVDGNGDGRKDPFDMTDAMASIGSYLQKAGWKENGDEQRLRTAIWRYNHSDIYVNTILKLYRELSSREDSAMGPGMNP